MSDEGRDDRMKDRLSGRFNTGDGNDDNEENDVVDVVEDNDDNDENDSNDDVAPEQRRVRDTTGRTFYVGEDTLDVSTPCTRSWSFATTRSMATTCRRTSSSTRRCSTLSSRTPTLSRRNLVLMTV
jgi:hypothetical protein